MRWVALASIPYWIAATFSRDFSNSLFNFVLFLGLLVSLIVVQIYRYRRVSNSIERQQTKWVIFGIVVAIGAYIIELIVLFLLLPSFFQLSSFVICPWRDDCFLYFTALPAFNRLCNAALPAV